MKFYFVKYICFTKKIFHVRSKKKTVTLSHWAFFGSETLENQRF